MKKRLAAAVLLAGTLSLGTVASAAENGQQMEEITTESTSEGVPEEKTEETAVEASSQETEPEVTEDAVDNSQEISYYNWGDPADITKDELIAKTEEALQEISSMKSEMILEMGLIFRVAGEESDTAMEMNIDMNMNFSLAMEEIQEPYMAHKTETSVTSFMGRSEKVVSESYIREENGKLIEYKKDTEDGWESEWDRKNADADESFLNKQGMDAFGDSSMMELLNQKAVDETGKEYYVLEAKISLDDKDSENEFQDKVKDLLEEMEDSFGEDTVQLPDSIDFNIYVSADDFLPAELLVDMSGIKGTLTDTDMEGVSMDIEFTTMLLRYRCSEYNAISEIVFPDDLPSAETEMAVTEISENETEVLGTEISFENETEMTNSEASSENEMEVSATEVPDETDEMTSGTEIFAEEEINLEALAEELGVDGIRKTADTSVSFTSKGAVENPAGLNEMGKVYLYNAESDMYEQAGLAVTGVYGGDEAAQLVSDLLNAYHSFYSFEALRKDEEYRIVEYDLYLPEDMTDSEYGLYSPNCIFDVVSSDGSYLEYEDWSYYVPTYIIYDENEYHPGDTVHCQSAIIMPKEINQYQLKFGPYGLDAFYVAIP